MDYYGVYCFYMLCRLGYNIVCIIVPSSLYACLTIQGSYLSDYRPLWGYSQTILRSWTFGIIPSISRSRLKEIVLFLPKMIWQFYNGMCFINLILFEEIIDADSDHWHIHLIHIADSPLYCRLRTWRYLQYFVKEIICFHDDQLKSHRQYRIILDLSLYSLSKHSKLSFEEYCKINITMP